MVYLFTNRCDQSKCTIAFFGMIVETFHILAGYLVTKVGFFYFHCSPTYNNVQSTKDSPSIRNDFSASPPPQKNGKYFLLSSREASHYQEHFSKWASSGINVHFSSFYILSITADSIWKVNSGEVNMDFKLYKSVICTNNASSTNQAKICLVLFSILNFIRVMHQKMFL